jgi:hypothetical protein
MAGIDDMKPSTNNKGCCEVGAIAETSTAPLNNKGCCEVGAIAETSTAPLVEQARSDV